MVTPIVTKLIKGSELVMSDKVLIPHKTNTPLDEILSSEGGLMPAVKMLISGGPGSGKSTLVLDMLANIKAQGKECLYVSAEMDEISHYKYCNRIPKFGTVDTFFIKHNRDNPKPAIEQVFESRKWDVIAIDSVAEICHMFKDAYGFTETKAETWFLAYQDKLKLENLTTFVNIQQTTKNLTHAGSQRLKHLVDSTAIIKREDPDSVKRTIQFDKNRDGSIDIKIYFSIFNNFIEYYYSE